jgi:hypothetical protein
MLKINLLPPTRPQRAVQWCKRIPETICWIPVMLLFAPVLVIVYLALKGYEVAYPCGCAVGRRLLGVQRRVSIDEAMEIARQAVGGEGRRCTMSLGERVSTYDIRIEALPTSSSQDDGKAMQLRIDMRDGRILSSRSIPCENAGMMYETVEFDDTRKESEGSDANRARRFDVNRG